MPAPTLSTVSGSLYSPSGDKVIVGSLSFVPTKPIPNNGNLVSAGTKIVIAGPVSFSLSPSFGIPYTVEFDPNPADTLTPTQLKSGYFKKAVIVPNVASIDIAALLS